MKLSIVISIYNGERFVESCILSLSKNKTSEMEIIAVDDGSSDKTLDILTELGKKTQLKIVSIRNIGLPGSRIEGLLAASGDYIYFMDVDDTLSTDFFVDIPRELERNHPDIVFFGAQRVFCDSRKPVKIDNNIAPGIYDRRGIAKDIIPDFFCTPDLYGKRNIITNVWAKVFKRDLLLSSLHLLKGRRIIVGEDLAISLSAALNAESISVLPYKAYYNYLTNSSSIMNTYKRDMKEDTSWLCSYLESLSKNSEYIKGVQRERAFFAISTYYNEFFFKNTRTKRDKESVIDSLCSDSQLALAIKNLEMRKVGFPNNILLKLFLRKKKKTLMALGTLIKALRPLLAKFILT